MMDLYCQISYFENNNPKIFGNAWKNTAGIPDAKFWEEFFGYVSTEIPSPRRRE